MLVNDCRVRFRYHSRCPLQWHYWLVGGGRGGRLLRDGSEHKDFQIWIKKLNFSLKSAQNVKSYNPKLLEYPCCKNVLSKTSGRALKGCLSSLTGSVGLSVAPRSCAATTQGAQKQTQAVFPHWHLQKVQQQWDLKEEGRKEGLWTQRVSERGKPRNLLCSSVKPLRKSPPQHSLPQIPAGGTVPRSHVRDFHNPNKFMLLLCAAPARQQDAEAGAELCSATPLVSSWDVPGCTAWFP